MNRSTALRFCFFSLLAGCLWLAPGVPSTGNAAAGEHGGHGGGHGMMGGKGKHGQGGHGGGKGGGLFAPDWRARLSDEQKARLDALEVAWKKAMAPMKARARAIRMDLVTMALEDEPNQRTLSSKVDEMLALKRRMMMARFQHVIDQRAVLTPEQRGPFDMEMLKAMGRKGGGHGKGGH